MKNRDSNKNIFIIENTEIGSYLPLSVYLTDLLRNFVIPSNLKINLIISKSRSLPSEIKSKIQNIFQIDTVLYSIKDNLKFSLDSFKILKKENKKERIDVIHCLYPNSSLLGAVLFKIFCSYSTKIIYDVRSPWIEMSLARGHLNTSLAIFYKIVLYTEEFFLTRFVSHFVFITEGLRRYYSKKLFINKNKSEIIPSGIDTNLFTFKRNNSIRDRYKLRNDDIVLGIIGTIGVERKLDFLIDAFKKLNAINKTYKLMIIGEGVDKKRLEELSEKLQINDNVIFTGKIPHYLMPDYISGFDMGICHLPDIFVFRRSFPLKILEYLACGIPVIASNIKAHREISKVFKNIYLYELDERNFINVVKKIVLNKPFLGNKEFLKNNYDWASLSRKYTSIYERV